MVDNNIPAIYNYCDRWCERCKYTNRCANFASMPLKGEYQTKEQAKEYVQQVFDGINKMLLEKAAELGINWDEVIRNANNASTYIDIDKEREEVRKEELSVIAKKYSEAALQFIEQSKLDDNLIQLLQQRIDLGLSSIESATKEGELINDCFDVIKWYMFFIPAKIYRALSGRNNGLDDEIQNDVNGSAKIALLTIDKSLTAYQELLPYYSEDDLLDKLAMLCELKRKLIDEFPKVLLFVRPGFDEELN